MTAIVHDDAFDAEGYRPSALVSKSGMGKSYGKEILKIAEPASEVFCGIWKAEPGEYEHPGGPHGETFVVIAGHAEMIVAGTAPRTLRPGSIVTVPPNTPTGMKITETLHKAALIVARG